MNSSLIFPFEQCWNLYALFICIIALALWIDLRLPFHPQDSWVKAGRWSLLWVALSLLVGVGLYALGRERAPEQASQLLLSYLSGYLLEFALALDNLLLFWMIFHSLQIPKQQQHRVLLLGIIGALLLRALFIALGAWLLQLNWVVWLLGLLLILSGFQLMRARPERAAPPAWLPWLTRHLPLDLSDSSSRFLLITPSGWKLSRLALALIAVEIGDLIFAIDSVPAIYAITDEPLLVFTSNICAVLGLRSLYFVITELSVRLRGVHYGLAATLIFVGLKMAWLNPLYEGHFPITWSLAIIALLLTLPIAATTTYRYAMGHSPLSPGSTPPK